MYDLLKGMRVIEGSAFVAAPLGGMTLAQFGADVIRFDDVRGGLDTGRWPLTREGRSIYWAGLNKGKRSIRIDLRREEGQELVQALVTAPGDTGGMFLTNLPPRPWSSYETLKARRPDLIMLTVSGARDGSAHVDYTVNATVGFPMLTGPEGYQAPVNHVLPAWDVCTGHLAALGMMAADRHRARTGEGQHVRLALQDVALTVASHLGYIGEAEVNGQDRPREGNHLYGTFGRDFPTRDGRYVMICMFTSRHVTAVAQAMGQPDAFRHIETSRDLDLRREDDRYAARQEMAGMVEDWTKTRTLAEVSSALRGAGALWGPYRTFSQILDEAPELVRDNPSFGRIEQPGIGPMLAAGMPLDFAGLTRGEPVPAPVLGSDTDAVLSDVLKLDSGAIGRLHDAGIVAGALF